MKKLKTLLCLLLAVLMTVGVCSAFISATAAQDDGEPTYYEITFAIPDGQVIYTTSVASGETPVYTGPNWTYDDYYNYWLTGWSPTLAPADADTTYITEYIRVLRNDDDAKSRLRGDANGDGTVDILDATTIQRYLAGLYDDPYDIINVLGVTSDSSEVTILDATRIQRYLAGFENTYLIGEIVVQHVEWPFDDEPDDPTEPPTEEPTEPELPTEPYEEPSEEPMEEPTEEPTEPPTQAPTSQDPYELPPI